MNGFMFGSLGGTMTSFRIVCHGRLGCRYSER
jgi:hypothetical protein